MKTNPGGNQPGPFFDGDISMHQKVEHCRELSLGVSRRRKMCSLCCVRNDEVEPPNQFMPRRARPNKLPPLEAWKNRAQHALDLEHLTFVPALGTPPNSKKIPLQPSLARSENQEPRGDAVHEAVLILLAYSFHSLHEKETESAFETGKLSPHDIKQKIRWACLR